MAGAVAHSPERRKIEAELIRGFSTDVGLFETLGVNNLTLTLSFPEEGTAVVRLTVNDDRPAKTVRFVLKRNGLKFSLSWEGDGRGEVLRTLEITIKCPR